jgi:hypothetical protein
MKKKDLPLKLVLKKKWFDMYGNGKLEDYREIKPYWITRLLECNLPEEKPRENSVVPDNIVYDIFENGYWADDVLKAYRCQFKTFKWAELIMGYRKNRPMKLAFVKEIKIGKPNPEWCEPEDVGKILFIIKLELL